MNNNENSIKKEKRLTMITYADGFYEFREEDITDKPNNVSRYKKQDKDTYIDKETGEVKEIKHAETKYDSLPYYQRTMNRRRRRLAYSIAPIISSGGYCAYMTLTFERTLDSLDEMDDCLTKLIKALQYKYPNLQYCSFKELSHENYLKNENFYHIHNLFWFNEAMDKQTREDFKNFVLKKWRGGSIYDYKEITAKEDLNNVLFYLCNYSGSSEKSKQKRETLKHFPPYYNTVKEVKGLENPKPVEVDEFTEKSKPISYSEPNAACGKLKLAIYIDDSEITKSNIDDKEN